MTEYEYKESKQLRNFLELIEKSIDKRKLIQNKQMPVTELVKLNVGLSNDIIECQENIGLFIKKDYFSDFEKGISTTIYPKDGRVKFLINIDEDKLDDYEQVFAYSFGPFKPSLYFESKAKIIFIDWEPYMLGEDLKKYRTGQIDKLGGCRQSKDFPTYESLEAPTLRKGVDFCQKLLSRWSKEKTKDDIMHDHMCILEHNFFPALAFSGVTNSNGDYIEIYAQWNSDILTRLLWFYNGDIIIGCRNVLGYLCSYSGLFNVALSKYDKRQEGESTSDLLKWKDKNSNHEASIIGRNVVRSWFNRNLGGSGASALLDDSGTLWIGYVHAASRRRDQWSEDDQKILADWIHKICKENGLIK